MFLRDKTNSPHGSPKKTRSIDPLILRISTFMLVVIMGYDGEFQPTDSNKKKLIADHARFISPRIPRDSRCCALVHVDSENHQGMVHKNQYGSN